MSSLINKPFPIPFTKEVLPAPIGPFNKTIDLGDNFFAKLFPNDKVSDEFPKNTKTS